MRVLSLTTRTSGSLFIILLLTSALFVSVSSVVTPPKVSVAATLTVTLTPNYGKAGDVIMVTATGVTAANRTSCKITSTVANVVTKDKAMVINVSPTVNKVHGSFVVGTGVGPAAGFAHTITVTCPATGTVVDSGTALFTLLPSITISPDTILKLTTSRREISITGQGFASDAGSTCTLTTTPTIDWSTQKFLPKSCAITSLGVLSAAFYVNSTAVAGTYWITVVPTKGNTASAQFYIVAGPTIRYTSPTSATAPRGYGSIPDDTTYYAGRVTITGGGFNNGTRTCILAVTQAGNVVNTTAAALSLFNANWGCLIDPTGAGSGVYASFEVSLSAYLGTYNVSIIDPLDTAILAKTPSLFTVTAAPTISIYIPGATSGYAGQPVNLTIASGAFSTLDKGPCAILSTPAQVVDTSSVFCLIDGSGVLLGYSSSLTKPNQASFVVSSNAPGQIYSLVIRSLVHGDASNGTASPPTYTVLSHVVVNPISGSPALPAGSLAATTVSISGTGFKPFDKSCIITYTAVSPANLPNMIQVGYSCQVTGSTGALSASFTVAPTAAYGTATLTVTTTLPETAGNTPQFNVVPRIWLTPSSGVWNSVIGISGTGFANGTSTVACNSVSSAPPNLLSLWGCSVHANGTVVGAFQIIPGAAAGSYTVTVNGRSASDSASYSPFLNGAMTTQTTTIMSTTSSTTITGTTSTSTSYTTTLTASTATSSTITTATATTTPTTTHTTTATPTTTITTSSVTLTTSPITSTATTVSTKTGPWEPPRCVIATVAFGSEVSSAVQFLRSFRDGLVLSTKAGSAFMEVFNAWYYSFSPSVAGFIANNDPLRAPVRMVLYPLLGVLGISTLTYSMLSASPEFAVVVAGLVASSLIGLVYLTLPAILGVRVLLKRRRIRIANLAKCSLALLTVALALLAIGEVAGSFLLLAVGGSVVVLTCLVAAPIVAALAMLRSHPE